MMTPGHFFQLCRAVAEPCRMHCLTSGYRTEPFFLPNLFAWLEDHPNPLGCCSLPNSNLSSPQHSAKGLGKSPAAVKSRAACAEASLEMQKLEVKELGTSPAQPPQPQPCPWCCSPAVQSLSHVPAHHLGGTAVSQGERMLSTPGAGYPHHHSCLCPCPHACWLLCRCPGSSTGHPSCLSLARDKPGAEDFVGTPQPWASWIISSFQNSAWH